MEVVLFANPSPDIIDCHQRNRSERMTNFKFVILAVIGCSLGFFVSIDVNRVSGPPGILEAIELTFSKAHAARRGYARRSTRRVSRRTRHRRVIRRTHLPRGCVRRGAYYYYCGGVYYQPIVESGRTVYIVVTP